MMFTTLVRTMTLEGEMLDHNTLSSVAEQMMGGLELTVEGKGSRVTRTGTQRLRISRGESR